jgi:hypothetical protein
MASTVEDFWRMVVEHNICTMVQLTADFDEAFKYWSITDTPGSEASFGSMKITLDSKEMLPSYIKREFTVYNQVSLNCKLSLNLSSPNKLFFFQFRNAKKRFTCHILLTRDGGQEIRFL